MSKTETTLTIRRGTARTLTEEEVLEERPAERPPRFSDIIPGTASAWKDTRKIGMK